MHAVENLFLNEQDISAALAKSEKALADMQAADVITPSQMRNELLDFFADNGAQKGDPMPWERTESTIKLRMGEVSIWAGINGHGKSLMLGQVIAWQLKNHKALVASFEMKPWQTAGRMIQQITGCVPAPEFLDRVIRSIEGQLFVYRQVQTINPNRALALIHYGAETLGCKHFVLDSLTKCGIGYDDYNGQTKFVNELQQVSKALDVHVHLVCHMRKQDKESTVGDKFGIRGAGGITDLADNIFIVTRNKAKEAVARIKKNSPEKTLSEYELALLEQFDVYLSVEKNREGGEEGKFGLNFHKPSLQFTSQENRAMPCPLRIVQ